MPTCGILLSTNMTGYRQLYGANFTLSETANRYTRYFSSHSQEEENTSKGGQPQTADNATQASTNSSKVPSNSATYALFIKGIPFLLLITIVLFLYLICLKMNLIDCFWTLLKKMGFSLGSRVLSKCWGWEGGLLLVVGILSTFGIMDDRAIMKMTSGEDTVNPGPHRGDAGPSESSSSWRKYLNFSSDKEEKAESEASTARVPQPSTSSSWSGSWIEKWFSPEGSSAAPNQGQQPQGAPEASTGTSSRAHQPAGPSQSEAGGPIRVSPSSPSSPSPSWFEGAEIDFQKRLGDQGEVSSAAQNERQQGEGALFQPTPPANPVASRGEEAGPSNRVPPEEKYPYQPDEIIGGDSVSSIERRLLARFHSPTAEDIDLARMDAQDLFEVKVDIIRHMAGLDPAGDWLGRGARALDNPRTATGESSLERLYALLEDLNRGGVRSETFSYLKERVLSKRGGGRG